MKKHYLNGITGFILGVVLLSILNVSVTNAQKINREVTIPAKLIRPKPAPKVESVFLNVSLNDITFNYQRDNKVIAIKTNSPTISVTNVPEWCSYELAGDNDFLILTCAENQGVVIRAGKIKIIAEDKTATISVMQNAANAYLSVLLQTDAKFENPLISENKTIYVTSNYPDWEVSSDADWCKVAKTDNAIQVFSSPTNGNSRTATVTIKAGDATKNITVVQKGGSTPYGRELITKKAMNNGITQSLADLHNGVYKGSISNNLRSYFGCYLWENGNLYIGDFDNDSRNGYGIYMIPDDYQIPNCPDSQYFVGQWIDDSKLQGSCYDSQGNLLYYGDFSDDKPCGTYPSTGGFANYKFEFIKDDNNNVYIGETLNQKPEGYGMYIYANGDIWYGSWKNGQRDDSGTYMKLDGTITSGQWDGDNYSND